MPLGTGAVQSATVPAEPFEINPDGFFSQTRKNEHLVEQQSMPTPGQSWQRQLPQTGIISRLKTTFVGQLVVSSAAVTPSNRWPYGLMNTFQLSANGQNQLWNCSGEDLHSLRSVRYPSYAEEVDVFPGLVGGGGTIAVGTHPLYLTWETPIAVDDTSLVGALYAQSGATNLALDRNVATMAQLFSALPANASITGTFHTEVTRFSVPRSAAEGSPLLIPDLSRLHGFNVIEMDYSASGDVRVPLVRSAGQLHRLFVSAEKSPNARLSALPDAAAANRLDRFRFVYGAGETPYDYSPAASLLARNNDHYGSPAPYDRLVLDFVRENAPRDIVLLQGVTEAAAIVTVNSAATIAGGKVRMVQETLF
jgi:hypothetical protein